MFQFTNPSGAYEWHNEHTVGGYYFFPEIYDHFEKEYKKSGILYREFIDEKNLGLVTHVTKDTEQYYGTGVHSDYYKIVDKKKWMLAKIKYGI